MKYLAGIALFFLLSCSQKADQKIEHSFYFWKTSFASDSNASNYISKENIGHFYIRYFDVDWDDNSSMPVPVAAINGFGNSAVFTQAHFTPVIFITNRCMERMNDQWCDSLPYKIRNRISFITNKLQQPGPGNQPGEIQIDCDWTPRTSEKYFRFLKNFKRLYPGTIISATIRLYPYKYFEKTGVPPVDKGLLMCYNLSDIRDTGNANSIFNIKNLKQYLVSKNYPLPLDIALPVFGWYAWFSGNQFKGIIYPENNVLLTADKRFFQEQTAHNFLVTGDTMINNNYLRNGDLLRMEYPDPQELEEAAKMLHDKIPGAKRIALFYWDEFLIQKNETTIHKIYSIF